MIASKNYSGILALALFSGVLAGCGGGGSNPTSESTPTLALAGGISASSGPAATDIPASGTESTITVGADSVLIPASDASYPAGTPVAVLSDSAPIFSGVTGGAALSRALGDVIVTRLPDGPSTVFTGLVNSNMKLTRKAGLLPGNYQIQVDGPWTIRDGNKALTTQTFVFETTVSSTGKISLPKSLNGKLPANGQSTSSNGAYVSGSVDNEFAQSDVTLRLVSGSESLGKTVVTSGSSASGASFTFQDLVGGFTIPSNGLQAIQYKLIVE